MVVGPLEVTSLAFLPFCFPHIFKNNRRIYFLWRSQKIQITNILSSFYSCLEYLSYLPFVFTCPVYSSAHNSSINILWWHPFWEMVLEVALITRGYENYSESFACNYLAHCPDIVDTNAVYCGFYYTLVTCVTYIVWIKERI